MIYGWLFLLGLTVGSFLNVVIFRLRFGDSPFRGRSYCDHCHKKIPWYDNIPLLSFVLLGGKCRNCQKKISAAYPAIEFLVGLEFVWVYWLLTTNFNFFGQVEGFYSLGLLAYWLILFSGLIAMAVYDLKYMIIPDEILWPVTLVAFLRLFFSHQWQVVPAGLVSSAFLGALYLITRGRGMGLGDVKLAFLMGLVLGWPLVALAYFVAFLTGAAAGVTGKKKLKSKIAFGPFLILGTIIAKLWGLNIIKWYIGFL